MAFGVDFKDFVKDPVKAMLFFTVLAISGLFTYLQTSQSSQRDLIKEQLLKCDTENYTIKVEIKQLREQFYETAGLLKKFEGRFEALEELKKQQ